MITPFTLALMLLPVAGASETFGGWDFYVGDPHAHSGVSKDGFSSDLPRGCGTHTICGEFAELFETAESNELDWVAMSEHTNGVGFMAAEDEYAALIEMALDHDDEGTGLVTVPAAEVWFDTPDSELGHKNLLFFGTDEQIEGLNVTDASVTGTPRSTIPDCDTIRTWAEGLRDTYGPLLLIPHHPALDTPMPTNWDCTTDGLEPAVETYSHFGNSLGGHIDYDPPLDAVEESGQIHNALDPDGYALKLGFVGGSDWHGSTPGKRCTESNLTHYGGGGLTVAMVPEGTTFDRTALYDAIMARQTYATSGPVVPLTVTYEADGFSAGVGEDSEVPGGATVTATVTIDPAFDGPVQAVWMETPDGAFPMIEIATGVYIYAMAADDSMPAWSYPAIQIDGPTWFGDEWCDDAGDDDMEWVWVSPTWFEVVDHDDDGDGSSWADGDCDDEDPTQSPLLIDYAYDGVDVNCGGADVYDADADGSDWPTDCDDTDATITPGGPELWYNGIDNDCAGGDDYDADGDGVDWGPDCNDADAAVNPSAFDVWYDGVDSDCRANDDFDRDGDGWRLGFDCNDDDGGIHPGARDPWYDGVDADCDGRDDLDRDGDGHRAFPFGDDCIDGVAWVHPGAFDRAYDGVDADCARDNDFDADHDGDVAVRFGGGDCKDLEPTVSSHVVETWYDGVDANCDRLDDFDQDIDKHRIRPFGGDPDDSDPTVMTGPR